MPKSALIIVDMQNDFLTGSLALKSCPAKEDGEEVVELINKLSEISGWDLVVFTMDWHPDDHISFVTNAHKFEQHPDSKVEKQRAEVYDLVSFAINGVKREQIMWPPHCIQGSWGSQLHKDLKVPQGSHQVKKGIRVDLDAYSAFFDNDKLNETELQTLLKSNGIERTFICGVATDICVNHTVFDSLEIGFETYLIEDACRGVHGDHITNTKKKMKEQGVHVINSEQVESLLSERNDVNSLSQPS